MKGIVVAPQPAAAELGVDVLERGGNVFDAAVAAGFMQMVVDPFMCGLGGWGHATAYDARKSAFEHIGFWARIGSGMDPKMWQDDIIEYTEQFRIAVFDDYRNIRGYSAIMTPGTVSGLWELHRRHASLPWDELLRPSIELSARGFPIPEYVAVVTRTGGHFHGMPHPRTKFAWNVAARELFHDADGNMKEVGAPHVNRDQARSLERISRYGADDFYRGELADMIVADFGVSGAFVTRGDLEQYQSVVEEPLRLTYRRFEIASAPPPGGGLMVLEALKVLEQFDLGAMDHNGPEHAFVVAGALAWVGVTRGNHLADPRFAAVPVDELLSEEHAEQIAARIRCGELPDARRLNVQGFTTNLAAIDEDGNSVALTHTLSSCAGIVVPGTGFTWNDCVAYMDPLPDRVNSYDPGRARAAATAPTLIFKGGAPWMTVGALGGWAISSAVTQSISNVIDFGMSPTEAVGAPRFQTEGSPVYCELRMPRLTVEALRSRGVDVQQSLQSFSPALAKVQMATVENGYFRGGADPRQEGGVVALAR